LQDGLQPMRALFLASRFSLSKPPEKLEILLILRASRRFLHLNEIIERGKPDERPAEPGFDLVRPDASEGSPFHKGMDIRLDEVLADEQLLGEQVIDADIRHVIAKCFERFACTLGISRCRFDEEIDVQGGTGIPVDGKGGRSDDDEPDLMIF